ncbi:CHAT domain-containing protein [candidate division KSB3 bacterium]|nr:CHAT domain-containing protein [candidate division KSB3 bacterium]
MVDMKALERGAQATLAPLPPLKYHTDPIEVTLRVRAVENASAFDMDIHTDSWDRIRVNISKNGLERLNTDLQKVLNSIAREFRQRVEQGWKPSGDELSQALYDLAFQGSNAFRLIFGESPKDQTAIRAVLEQCSNGTICIASDDFFIPWEILYDGDLATQSASFNHFWGMRYIIARYMRPGTRINPILEVGAPRVGLLTNERILGVKRREIPFFEGLAKKGRIVLYKLRALDPDHKRAEFEEFRRFWQQGFHIAHFACHGSTIWDAPDESWLELTNRYSISIRDLRVLSFRLENHPLVILNACATGSVNPLYTASFADAFLGYGARGVVATECSVPDTFAFRFIKQMYELFLGGMSLGEAMLTTRRQIAKRESNPCGLLYAMYASPTTSLKTA